jgi:hypothetical protein
MTRFLAPVFAVVALLALLGALASLVFLPGALTEFEREPEDVYLLVFWATLLSLLGLFWLRVAARSFRRAAGPMSVWGRLLSASVALVGSLVAVVGLFDPLDGPWLIGLGLLCVSSAGIYVWMSRPRRRAPERSAAGDVRPSIPPE